MATKNEITYALLRCVDQTSRLLSSHYSLFVPVNDKNKTTFTLIELRCIRRAIDDMFAAVKTLTGNAELSDVDLTSICPEKAVVLKLLEGHGIRTVGNFLDNSEEFSQLTQTWATKGFIAPQHHLACLRSVAG